MFKFGVSACFISLLGVAWSVLVNHVLRNGLPGDHRALEPPDSISNSEVKRRIADGSVGFPHVRVGHRQAYKFDKTSCVISFEVLFYISQKQSSKSFTYIKIPCFLQSVIFNY